MKKYKHKQTVYILTRVEDELPEENCKLGIIINNKFDFAYWMKVLKIFDHHRSGLNHRQKDITHWLKPTEGYFFTPEELEPLQDIVNEGYDAYDETHHLIVQRWLKTIENFLNKEK